MSPNFNGSRPAGYPDFPDVVVPDLRLFQDPRSPHQSVVHLVSPLNLNP
jgi:hypothetical protein